MILYVALISLFRFEILCGGRFSFFRLVTGLFALESDRLASNRRQLSENRGLGVPFWLRPLAAIRSEFLVPVSIEAVVEVDSVNGLQRFDFREFPDFPTGDLEHCKFALAEDLNDYTRRTD